jgi:hypothetical protein
VHHASTAASPADPEETPLADGAFRVGVGSSVVGIAVGDDVGRNDLGIRGFGSSLGLGFALDLILVFFRVGFTSYDITLHPNKMIRRKNNDLIDILVMLSYV